MITLKNEFITAKINELGAELKSLNACGTEYIWNGDPKYWACSCPVLFPICGGLKDDKFTFGGREWTLKKHGYARHKTFSVESSGDTSAVFLSVSDEDTKAQFPFDYELRIIYTLSGKTLKIDYSVKNKSNGNMYFSIGSHEGYFTPEGVEEYDVLFPQKETLERLTVDGNLLNGKAVPVIKESDTLPLKKEYFYDDALIFKGIKSRSVTLKNRNGGRSVTVDFPDDKYFLIWQNPGAPYVCLEPWSGIPDSVDSTGDIREKEGIITLGGGCEYFHTHSITVNL
ncbi:MAG: aldose 1-epimerase family protein [Clostridia bacterium]|nr:aldose 1-epimerase family protein [Clostridia bacterium]